MTKLFRYVKKYSAYLVMAVVLLFGQAILDLNLPNMMSNIVNIGIQNSGIEEIAPRAVAQESHQVFTLFMSEDDLAIINEAYTPFSELSANAQAEKLKTFPEAQAMNAYILTATGELRTKADSAYGRASYAMMSFIKDFSEKSGQPAPTEEESQNANMDLSRLPMIGAALGQMPPGAADSFIKEAAAAPELMTVGIIRAFNKAFYVQLGADTGAMQTAYILRTGGVMLLLSLLVLTCAVGAGFCFARIGAGVAHNVRRDVYAKVNSFSNAEMDKFSTSSLITRTTNDVTQVQTMYTMVMRMLIYAPIMGVGGVIMAMRKSSSMSWIMGLAVLAIMIVIGIMYVVVMPRFTKMQQLTDRLNLVARENLTGIMVVRAFGNQKFQEKRFESANDEYAENNLFVNRSMAAMFPIMMLIMNGLSLLIIWVGGHQIANSTIQIGDMIAFIQYSMQVVMAFIFITVVFIMVPRAAVSAKRINEVLNSDNTVKDPEAPKSLGHRAKGEICFNNVSFRYAGADEDVLHNISFTAKPGQTTAFIGSTGSGKSTLINLIPRFYDATGGSITLDGVDIREMTQHELRENIGYVPQKGVLFTGTIEDNLRYGNENADSETLRAAADIAQATEFIDTLDQGFASEISQGGTNVSGGQRQRLSIARALVKKAPVYIFDDSFSALDFATDARLRAALKPYTQESAVLIVAQRVSTIMTAEQIIVMENGRTVGIGTHRELLENCPTYREIAESQLSKEELA